MFSLQARDVIRMDGYTDADKRFDKAYFGRYNDKAVYLSRNRSLLLEQEVDVYHCQYMRHTCVSFYKDGRMVLDTCGWETPSTSTFIYRCTGVRTFTHHGTCYACVAGGYYPARDLTLRRRGDTWNFDVLEYRSQEVCVPDMKRRRELQAIVRQWKKRTLPLALAITPSVELGDAYAQASELVTRFDPLPSNTAALFLDAEYPYPERLENALLASIVYAAVRSNKPMAAAAGWMCRQLYAELVTAADAWLWVPHEAGVLPTQKSKFVRFGERVKR